MDRSNMQEIEARRERVSALADGQLDAGGVAAAVDAVLQDEDARECWHLYHLVGDVLRSPELAQRSDDGAFVQRMRQRLEAEAASVRQVQPVAAVVRVANRPEAANAVLFRWRMVAALASIAAVAAIGWAVSVPGGEFGAQLAQAPQSVMPPAVTTPSGLDEMPAALVMVRDPHLDELLAAHRQVGGGQAINAASGFLRNATYVVPER